MTFKAYKSVRSSKAWWKNNRGVTSTKCSRKTFTKSLNETRKAFHGIPKDLRPLFKHIVELAKDSYASGACKRAGRELYAARRLTRHAK